MATLLPCVPGHYELYYNTTVGPSYYPDEPFKSYLSCFCGYFQITLDGGDEGASVGIPISESCSGLRFRMQGTRGGAQSDKAQVVSGGVVLYESNCAPTDFDSGWLSLPAGSTSIQALIYPNCSGGTGTYWYFNLTVFCV